MSAAAQTSALWFLGRGTGVVSLLMLTLAVCLGVLTRSGRRLPGLPRFALTDLHRTASLTGVALVLVHVVSLLLDPYAQLRLLDVVLPFGGSYRPAYLGLGTLAVDLLLVVVVTSLLRHRLGPRVFRGVHWLTYVLWPLALAHGLGVGTDSPAGWFRALAVACVVAVVAVGWWRLSPAFAERGHARTRREVAPR